MATCGDQGCNCLVEGGQGIVVTGGGTAKNPYKVAIEGDLTGTFSVVDTESVNLSLNGQGTGTSPYVLTAVATVRLSNLADVNDPQGGPNIGDVPVWVGGGTPHWEFQPPPPNPAGSVNTGDGLDGDGTLGAPLEVSVIGTSAGGSTSGLEVYVDRAGNLRAVNPGVSSVAWTSVTGKPSVFPSNDANFSGTLSVGHGGTGSSSLSTITVGNSTKVDGHRIFVQSATPTADAVNDLWFW